MSGRTLSGHFASQLSALLYVLLFVAVLLADTTTLDRVSGHLKKSVVAFGRNSLTFQQFTQADRLSGQLGSPCLVYGPFRALDHQESKKVSALENPLAPRKEGR